MFELVPSKYMRDYFQKVGFTFTDFQKATLIWNMPEKLWRERLDALRELAESTDDARTRRQITERVEAEKKKKRLFEENPDKWSNELSEEEDALIDEFRKDRFESQYIKIPYEMKTGWQVKDVTDGSFYVLDTGKEIWDNDMKRVDQNPKFYDFSDVQVVVFRLTESGVWSHEHINPMYLTVESVPDAPGDERQQAYKKAMDALSGYFSVEKSDKDAYGKAGAYALECSREYAAVCRRQQWDVKELENAEDVEKILCVKR